MSAKSAASLYTGSLSISVLYEVVFTKHIESLRLLSLQVHSFWTDERPIFLYKLHFLRKLAKTRGTHVEI